MCQYAKLFTLAYPMAAYYWFMPFVGVSYDSLHMPHPVMPSAKIGSHGS